MNTADLRKSAVSAVRRGQAGANYLRELTGRPPDRNRLQMAGWTSAAPALRRKWATMPAGTLGRVSSDSLLELDDDELLRRWRGYYDQVCAEWEGRGWFYKLYPELLTGKRVLDVGSGLGYDGMTFIAKGAHWTFMDIVPSNIELLGRLSELLGNRPDNLVVMSDLATIDSLGEFDFIWCDGSLLHAPFDTIAEECAKLLEHLPPGGQWVELTYPKSRWIRQGRLPFDQWGEVTDGKGTPWAEWYDIDKLLRRMSPAHFRPLLAFDFHGGDFNWFHLERFI